MKESLAARQAALLRQNAELDQKVEAIDQRRQQQQQLHHSTSGKATSAAPAQSLPLPLSAEDVDQSDGGGVYDDESDAASSPDRAQLRFHVSSVDLGGSVRESGSEQLPEKKSTGESLTQRRSQIEKKKSTGANETSVTSKTQQSRRPKSAQEESDNNDAVGGEAKRGDATPDTKDDGRGGGGRGGGARGEEEDEGDGLGLEATVRYQKARIRVLQDELDGSQSELKELQSAHTQVKTKIEELTSENSALRKKQQQTQQLLDKQQELSAAQESKQKILETQLSAAQTKMEEIQKAEKQASQQFRSKDVRLNRALEELEKAKAQLQDERRTHGDQMVAKGEYEQVLKDNKRLEKQKNELLVAFKKQMKLIDLLKRQRIHMEAAKMLSFTEEEFSKTLELG